jgi:glycerol-3-phosphate acyltransferase PlsY
VILVGYLFAAVVAYLLGSIPTGYLMGRVRGIDIRQVGSGNIGATNAFRTLGTAAGILVLALDGFKGYVACHWVAPLAYVLFVSPDGSFPEARQYLAVLTGLAAIVGHIYTCWLHFRGGKGIATTAGVFVALAFQAVLVTIGAWTAVFAISRYVSLASIAAAVCLPIMVLLMKGSALTVFLTATVSLLALFKHKGNMQRLLNGTEHRFGAGKSSAPHHSSS